MPLVRVLGGESRSDNTERIKLQDAADGQPREITVGDPDYYEVSGDELLQLASSFEVEVKPEGETGEPSSSSSPGQTDWSSSSSASSSSVSSSD
jgi:hypothetical protein